MSLPRLTLAISLVIATLIACLAPRGSSPAETIPARELLLLVQKGSGHNYTYDRATGEALDATAVPRPAKEASVAALESALRDAGFHLSPVGPEHLRVFLVERART